MDDVGPDWPGVPRLVAAVARARGLEGPDALERFCHPRLTELHPPADLPGVDEAAGRLVEAVRDGRSIAIYGDYDVDGITATAILHHVITAVAPDVRLRRYVPHRLDEGYGLSGDALRKLREDGADVVVSVDCGITAVEPARVAREVGLELIITDHHHLPPDAVLPDALLVHPGLPGGTYPFRELCGAGVAYKLAWRFANRWCGSERVGKTLQQVLLDLLPLAALGTIADVVPLVGENRILTRYGLSLIRAAPWVGLKALIIASGLAEEGIDSEKVGFVLGPRLNACGRMGHAAEAVELLTTAPEDEAMRIAERLTELNRERQRTERGILERAIERAEAEGQTGDDHRAIVLADADWHPGVVGIVCSRLVERYGRPAVLMQTLDGTCRGSARSVDGYSIHDGLTAVADHLRTYGGHDAAAGLALDADRLDGFRAALVAHANAHITVEQLLPRLRIDVDGALAELSEGAVRRLQELAPFGRANPRPVVRIQGVTVDRPPQVLGGQGRHLALHLREDAPDGRQTVRRAVWWGEGARAATLVRGMRLDVVVVPKLNTWRGRTSVEAEIRDVRRCDGVEAVTLVGAATA